MEDQRGERKEKKGDRKEEEVRKRSSGGHLFFELQGSKGERGKKKEREKGRGKGFNTSALVLEKEVGRRKKSRGWLMSPKERKRKRKKGRRKGANRRSIQVRSGSSLIGRKREMREKRRGGKKEKGKKKKKGTPGGSHFLTPGRGGGGKGGRGGQGEEKLRLFPF